MTLKTSSNELSVLLSNIPYSERIVLLPQCLRSNQCKAPRKKFGILECQKCCQKRDDGLECPIPLMVSTAYEIGYGGVYIFTGGSGIVPFFKNRGLPKAVLGVACEIEIRQGKEKMAQIGIPSQIEYLLKDGCAETIFFKDLSDFEKEWIAILTKFPPK